MRLADGRRWTLLQIVPDSDVGDELLEKEDDAIYCARCGHLATRGRWRLSMFGGHEHALSNPAGQTFQVLCFKEAPGAAGIGDPTLSFTWFKGYRWQMAPCRECATQLGWQYTGEGSPPIFFGLIRSRLSSMKPPED